MNIRVNLITFMLGLMVFNPLHAEQSNQSGIIDRIDTEENMLVIGDRGYTVLSHVLVHGKTDSIGIKTLRENMPVRITYEKSPDNKTRPVINEIWILDKLPPREYED